MKTVLMIVIQIIAMKDLILFCLSLKHNIYLLGIVLIVKACMIFCKAVSIYYNIM